MRSSSLHAAALAFLLVPPASAQEVALLQLDDDVCQAEGVVRGGRGACEVREQEILVSGSGKGTHFFTVRAKDEGGKTTYGHFVIDVKR